MIEEWRKLQDEEAELFKIKEKGRTVRAGVIAAAVSNAGMVKRQDKRPWEPGDFFEGIGTRKPRKINPKTIVAMFDTLAMIGERTREQRVRKLRPGRGEGGPHGKLG